MVSAMEKSQPGGRGRHWWEGSEGGDRADLGEGWRCSSQAWGRACQTGNSRGTGWSGSLGPVPLKQPPGLPSPFNTLFCTPIGSPWISVPLDCPPFPSCLPQGPGSLFPSDPYSPLQELEVSGWHSAPPLHFPQHCGGPVTEFSGGSSGRDRTRLSLPQSQEQRVFEGRMRAR